MNSGFWHGKRVFLTGHTGFKGSWLSLWLQALGAEVFGYALKPPTAPNLFTVAAVGKGMDVCVIADIRDASGLRVAMQAASPEIVFHLAAQPLVRYSYANPSETYAVNVMGTVNLFEAVRATPAVRAVVNVTSDKCYENREWLWGYREDEALGGFDPYSSSKGCAELITAAYRRSFLDVAGVALASARAGNVIGGGDWAAERLIPDILRAVREGQPMVIRNPHALRPWQHVLEPLAGYLILAQKLHEQGQDYAEAWNFGPNDSDVQPVQWVVDQFMRQCGPTAHWERDQSHHPHEAQTLKLDSSKAKARLYWTPNWSLTQAVERTVTWHLAYEQRKDMREFTLAQIADYQSSVQ